MPLPGVSARVSTVEGNFLLQDRADADTIAGQLAATVVDAGSAVTTTVRPGFAVAEVPLGSGTFQEYDQTRTDGREIFAGFLLDGVNMLDGSATAIAQPCKVVVRGFIDQAVVFGLDSVARAQTRNRFLFRDQWNGPLGENFRKVVAKTANYVVVAADRGTLFSTQGAAGAIQFTLPALSAVGRDFHVGFVNEVGQNMSIVRAGTDTIVAFNNAVATSLAFSTAANLISARLEIRVNADKTKFLAEPMGPHTLTVT